jgi:tRNA-dihydrouridine synthase 1
MYGSFLLEHKDRVVEIVRAMTAALRVPVTCKVRLLQTLDESRDLCLALQDAGCAMITIHGRTRFQNKVRAAL